MCQRLQGQHVNQLCKRKTVHRLARAAAQMNKGTISLSLPLDIEHKAETIGKIINWHKNCVMCGWATRACQRNGVYCICHSWRGAFKGSPAEFLKKLRSCYSHTWRCSLFRHSGAATLEQHWGSHQYLSTTHFCLAAPDRINLPCHPQHTAGVAAAAWSRAR